MHTNERKEKTMYKKNIDCRYIWLPVFITAFLFAAMILNINKAEAAVLKNQEPGDCTSVSNDITQNKSGKSEQTIYGELEYSCDLSSDPKSFKLELSAETNLIYESSDDAIAEVSPSGIVTIKTTGAVAIYVTAEENEFYKSAEAVATVDINDLGPDSDYDESEPQNGIWSKGIVWNFYEDGTLKIDGAGQLRNKDYFDLKEDAKKLVIGERITQISNNCFSYFDGLESVIIPDSVTSIGKYAFYSCSNLKSIIIPGSVKSVGKKAFDCCYDIKTIEFSEGVERIGDDAFYECKKIESAIIPASIEKIGFNIFASHDANFIIKGHSGTKADSYANQEGIRFWDIDNQTYNVKKAEWSYYEGDVKYYKTISLTILHDYADGFKIYRKASKEGKYRKIKDVNVKKDRYGYLLNDKKLSFNKKYYYRVKPYIKVGGKKYYGGYSYISLKTKLPRPEFNLSTTVKNGKRYNKIQWKKVKGASGYRVYNYNYKKKKYELIADKSNRTAYFIHKKIKKGKQYKYIVRAYRKVNGKKY